jgi:hypothetical protein
MEPKYMNENRYSYHVASWRPPANVDYESQTPESDFERRVQNLFLEGQQRLHQEEFGLALDAFRELQALILKTVHPKMPIDPNQIGPFTFPFDASMIDILSAKSIELMQRTPIPVTKVPPNFLSDASVLPDPIKQKFSPLTNSGLQITTYHGFVLEQIDKAGDAIERRDWGTAQRLYEAALKQVPATDPGTRASLLHDLAIINEKSNNRNAALQNGQESIRLFTEAKLPEAQAHALDTMTSVFTRAGRKDLADNAVKTAETLRRDNNLFPVMLVRSDTQSLRTQTLTSTTPGVTAPTIAPSLNVPSTAIPRPAINSPTLTPTAQPKGTALIDGQAAVNDAPVFMAATYIRTEKAGRAYNVQGTTTAATISLNTVDATASAKTFLQNLSVTADVSLLTSFVVTPIQMVAYLPHMYFFVIPMSIGDCYLGMGNLNQAEDQYVSVLPYPFINKNYEIVKLWSRLAEVYLEMGDDAYRRAKDSVAQFAEARTAYENIVRTDGTLNPNSQLYRDAKFAAIKTRITNFLAAADRVNFVENPGLTTKVLEAKTKLNQIKVGLNFFGFAANFAPPFSFEYLQNTARYFAQQAGQIEQRYIQYKTTAENEEFRREQLNQQAEVSRQSVVLEQRGVAEAQAGIAVAQASVNYAETQRVNAVQSQTEFNNVRWELLELAEAEAWSSAAAVGEDDEIKQTWNGNYYSSNKKNRSDVLQDLAYQRTRISHDLEAAKLQRAIDAANAYKGVAQAQVTQAQARKDIAEQRVQIAQLQQRYAEENRDFLDMREFSSRLWYELARQARRLKQRYLDMATEVAFLMERAYNAETERGLRVIRYDYSQAATNNLLGADFLLADIDYFTLDHVTTTQNKKVPVKKTISVADSFAMAFNRLKTRGTCFFQTELADFDRENPGLYLCKLRNIELVFVGITGATSIAGSLRNVGVSKFRMEGGAVVTRVYPSDVMPLSQYDLRQDALAFRFNPNDLRLFENNGIETLWQLDLPRSANTFDYDEILDVHLVLYYDGFFSPTLETTIKAALPTTGTASRAFSARMSFPDEMFYLKNKGEAELVFDAGMFPRNQTNVTRTNVTLKATGAPATINGLKLRLTSAGLPAEIVLTTNASGEVNDATPGQPLRALRNKPMTDKWTLRILAADNPGLVTGGALNLSGLTDVLFFFEYKFDYLV